MAFRKTASALAAALALAALLPAGQSAQAREVTAGIVSNLTTLDPWDANDNLSRSVASSIYESLYVFDTNLKAVPQLASGHEVTPDGLVYTFHLRDGVKFHDGSDFDAEAVVLNFNRALDPKMNLSRRTFFGFIDKVEAVDRLTVRFTLKVPTASFIARLSNGTAGMVCPSLLKRATTKQVTAYDACGTGPFKLVKYNPSEALHVTKFEAYRVKGLPKIDGIRWVPVPENNTRAMMLSTGEAQFVSPVPSEQMESLGKNPKLAMMNVPSIVMRYIAINESKKPYGDLRVREALNLAINRKALIKVAYNGFASPATGYQPPQIEGSIQFDDWEYNPAKARKLLAEAGYPNGFRTSVWAFSNDSKHMKMLQFLQQQLAQVGIKAETRALEAGQRTVLNVAKTPAESPHELYIIGWTNSTAEPDWGLRPHLDSRCAPPVLNNYSYYANPKVDALLDRALTETDPRQRAATYVEAQKLIHADKPWVPLVYEAVTAGAAKELRNFSPRPDGSFSFYEAEWRE